jgi:hypothetical protein
MYRVYVVNFREGLVVDEEGPFDARAEASPRSEAAKNRLNRFLPSGIRQLPRRML